MEKTVFIGAGLAGLSAARFRRGETATVYDPAGASGRIRTLDGNGVPVDAGAKFFCRADKAVWDLVCGLGLDKEKRPLDMRGLSVVYDKKPIVIKDAVNDGNLKRPIREMLTACEEMEKEPSKEFLTTDFGKWYRNNIGSDTQWFPEALARAITFAKPKEMSTLYGAIVFSTFFSECYVPEGGMKRIIEKLSSGISVKRERIESIEFEENTVSSLTAEGKEISVGEASVISGIPTGELKGIVGHSDLKSALGRVEYAGCVYGLLKTSSRNLGNETGRMFPEEESVAGAVINEARFYGAKADKELISMLIPIRKKVDAEKIVREIAGSMFPGIENEILGGKFILWEYGLPIHNASLMRAQEKINSIRFDNFAVCGDFMGLPSMDAAVESAKAAAEKLNKKA